MSKNIEERLTLNEIKELKIDFVHTIMPDKTFKNKGEIIERLRMYKNLYTIKNETERMFVNQMITVGNIPDELIEKKEQEKKEILPEVKYTCKICKEPLEDKENQFKRMREEWINGNITILREKHLEIGQYQCSNSKLKCSGYDNEMLDGRVYRTDGHCYSSIH